eukprot:182448-Hanusia_phi.AAC.1
MNDNYDEYEYSARNTGLQTSITRKKAFKTAEKQLNNYNILEFKEDELHLPTKTADESAVGNMQLEEKATSLKPKVVVQHSKGKAEKTHAIADAQQQGVAKFNAHSAKTVTAPRTAKLQWDGRGIPHF